MKFEAEIGNTGGPGRVAMDPLPAVGAGGLVPLVPTLPQRFDDDDKRSDVPNLKSRLAGGSYAARKNAPRVGLGVGASNNAGNNAAMGFHNSPRPARGADKRDKRGRGNDPLETFENLKANGKWLGGNPAAAAVNASALDDFSPRGFSVDPQQQNLQKARQRQRDREREKLRVQLADGDGDESVNTIQSDNSEYSEARRGEMMVEGKAGGKGRPGRRNNNEKVIGPGIGQLIGSEMAGRNRSLPMLQKGGAR